MINSVRATLSCASLMLTFGLLISAVPASSAPAPTPNELKARAACVAEAAMLKRKLLPGTCEDPRSGFRGNMRARELCERSLGHMQGTIKCRRDIVAG